MKKCFLKKSLIYLIILILVLILVYVFINLKNKKYVPYYSPDSRVTNVENSIIDGTNIYGWIQVQGTNIDYPIYKKNEAADTALNDYIWRIDNYSDSYNREVILGHNLLNVSSNPIINGEGHSRFENLMNFVYYDFSKDNMYINYTYDGVDHLFKIYAAGFYYHEYDSNHPILKSDKDSIENYIKIARENSIYDYDVDVTSDDKIITLVTCTRYFGRNGKTDFRIDARLIRENEKIDKYSVETNENYDIIK